MVRPSFNQSVPLLPTQIRKIKRYIHFVCELIPGVDVFEVSIEYVSVYFQTEKFKSRKI